MVKTLTLEEAFQAIFKGTAKNTGAEFFHALVKHLSEVLHVKYAFVGELLPDIARVQTIAVWAAGELVENFEYDLKGTPCENVVGQSLCLHSDDVQNKFPEDKILVDMGAESYLGVPLTDSDGNPRGILAVLDTKIIDDIELVRQVVTIFAARAGAELGRKHAEAELKETEKKYRSIFENSPLGIVHYNKEGVITASNVKLANILGSSVEKLVGFDALKLIKDEEMRAAISKSLFSGETGHYEGNYLSVTGGVATDVHAVFSPVLSSDGSIRGAVGILEDMTRRKQAEEKLRESEMRFRQFFENDPSYCYMVSPDGIILDVNKTALEVLGYEKEELVGRSPKDIYAQESQSKIKEYFEKLKKKGSLKDVEMVIRAKGGEKRTVLLSATMVKDADGKIVHSVSVQKDITDREQAKERLKISEARSRTWLEHSPVCTKIVDLDFNLQYMSSAGIKDLQINDITQFYGKPYPFDFYPESFRNTMTKNLEKAKETGEVITQEAPVVDLEGNELWFQSTLVPVNDEKGRIEYIIVVSLDITDRKKAEEEKTKLEVHLRQAYKMEAIGTMAGGIAHDFNNILAIILGNAEIASLGIPEGNSARNNIDKVKDASIRAKDLVKQILSFSRQFDDMPLIPIEPSSVIQKSMKLLRSTIPTTVDIVHNVSMDCGTIMADPTQIHQVLMNLFTNAVHAMDEKGTLELTEESVELDSNDIAYQPGMEPGQYLKISVRDTGVGMDKETQDRIFDPFYTTKDVDEGTGMGLSIVLSIVQSHGGMITVDSKPGEGTTFHIFLPFVEKEVIDTTKASEQLPRGNEKVLFVDDEEMLAELSSAMLEELGYQVTIKTNSKDALETFKSDSKAFNLVITDQTMPKMSGEELANEIMKIRPDIPVILCTGYSKKISAQKAKELGIKELCIKPLEWKQLAKTVRNVLDGK